MPQFLWVPLTLLAVWLVVRAAFWLPSHYKREEAFWLNAVKDHPVSGSVGEPCEPAFGVQLLQSFMCGGVPVNLLTLLGVIGVLAVAVWVSASLNSATSQLAWFVFGSTLVLLALVDIQTKLLPDALTLPMLWLGLVIQLFPETRTVGLEFSVVGAIAGYLPLWVLALAYRLIRGRDGLGMGDLKLLAAMGAWSGPFVLPQVLLLAALLAIALFVIERVLHRSTAGIHEERPFGPAIVAAYFIVMTFAHSVSP